MNAWEAIFELLGRSCGLLGSPREHMGSLCELLRSPCELTGSHRELLLGGLVSSWEAAQGRRALEGFAIMLAVTGGSPIFL